MQIASLRREVGTGGGRVVSEARGTAARSSVLAVLQGAELHAVDTLHAACWLPVGSWEEAQRGWLQDGATANVNGIVC